MTNTELWASAGSTPSSDTLAVYDLLVDRQDDGTITTESHHLLGQLRDELDVGATLEGVSFVNPFDAAFRLADRV